MKLFNTITNIVLLIAVAILFAQTYSTDKKGPAGEKAEAEKIAGTDFSGLRIAYINYDSLVVRYNYHQELKMQLETEAKALENELARKTRQFQENVALLQREAANLSEERLQREQMELQQIQQELMRYREEESQRLTEKEKELTQLLRDDLDDVLAKVKEEYKLDMIFSYDSRSDLLAVKDDFNITETVLSRLNKKYQNSKKDSVNTEG